MVPAWPPGSPPLRSPVPGCRCCSRCARGALPAPVPEPAAAARDRSARGGRRRRGRRHGRRRRTRAFGCAAGRRRRHRGDQGPAPVGSSGRLGQIRVQARSRWNWRTTRRARGSTRSPTSRTRSTRGRLTIRIGGSETRLQQARAGIGGDLWRIAILALPFALLLLTAISGWRWALASLLGAVVGLAIGLGAVRLLGELFDVSLLAVAVAAPDRLRRLDRDRLGPGLPGRRPAGWRRSRREARGGDLRGARRRVGLGVARSAAGAVASRVGSSRPPRSESAHWPVLSVPSSPEPWSRSRRLRRARSCRRTASVPAATLARA